MSRSAPAQTTVKSRIQVKRVLRRGQHFVCGMCGSQHQEGKVAQGCLERCLTGFFRQQPVNTVRRDGKTEYQCSYCKRCYENSTFAQKCASDCQSRLQQRSQKEQTIARKKLAGVRIDLPQAKAKGQASMSSGRDADAQEILAGLPAGVAFLTTGPSAPETSTAAATPTAKAPMPHDNAEKKKSSGPSRIDPEIAKKVLKDGRTMVCRRCGGEYATMQEAGQCYDRHPPQEKGEVIQISAEDRKKYRRASGQFECSYCGASHGRVQEAIKCYDTHDRTEENSGNQTAPEPIPAATPAPIIAIKNNPDDDKKFSRDGAKYICRECKSKFFTREDVISCFDGH